MSVPATLTISPVLSCQQPAEKLLRFLESEWELYDGVYVAQDGTIGLFDLLLSITVNSGLGSGDSSRKVRTIWNDRAARAATDEALGRIPPRGSLLDDDVPWGALEQLFNAYGGITGVGPAVATKVLHKKRPALIPMIDYFLSLYFKETQGQIPPTSSPLGVHLVENMRTFRQQLLDCREEIEALCGLAGERGFPISSVRAMEILIWIEREPKGYYRAI